MCSNKRIKKYQCIWFWRRIKRKLTGKELAYSLYAGKNVMALQDANDLMAQWILEKKSFAAARFGSIELRAVYSFDLPYKEAEERRLLNEMRNNAGFFPKDPIALKQFSTLMKTSSGQMDLIGIWFNRMEDYVIDCYGGKAELTRLRALEPWYVERPWTRALKGKKVLVVHPFAETIKKQYARREFLFDKADILPELGNLYVVKAVQTIAGTEDSRFQNWFQALDWMYEECMKYDFDVAIIGCGAYGFPLAARIKEAGRQAVHMGGATQLLFGIKGRRWDEKPEINKMYNEYWVRPDISETPQGAVSVEAGCYW